MDSSSESSYSDTGDTWSELSLRSDKIYGVGDVMKVQMSFLDTVYFLMRQDRKKSNLMIKLMDNFFEEHEGELVEFRKEIEEYMVKHERKLLEVMARIEQKTEDFGDELHELVMTYLKVNKKMKRRQKKKEAKRENFLDQVEKNVSLFQSAKLNLEKLQEQMASFLAPIASTSSVSSTDISKTFVRANTIANPMKPIETEIVTHTTRIVKELELLREQLQVCPNVDKLSAPMVNQSKKVTKMVLKELPARSMKAYIDTLPPEHRD